MFAVHNKWAILDFTSVGLEPREVINNSNAQLQCEIKIGVIVVERKLRVCNLITQSDAPLTKAARGEPKAELMMGFV